MVSARPEPKRGRISTQLDRKQRAARDGEQILANDVEKPEPRQAFHTREEGR